MDTNPRKRSYRQRIKCDSCGKEIDSDYSEKHKKHVHGDQPVTFSLVIDKSQQTLRSFFNPSKNISTTSGTCSGPKSSSVGDQGDNTSAVPPVQPVDADRPTVIAKKPRIISESSSDTETSDNEHSTKIKETSVNVPRSLSPPFPNDELLDAGPSQPILPKYKSAYFGRESTLRDFNSGWFKLYPWLSYDTDKKHATCYPCKMFMGNDKFSFMNWKKSHRLKKHARSSQHQQSMVKWIDYRTHVKRKTSVIHQISNSHKEQVAQNREYIKVIIQTLLYTVQQNIAQRGHEKDRRDLGAVSDINRGNFLELLHLRSRDIPWLPDKLNAQLDTHNQWTSPAVQNELIEIIADVVLSRIAADVKKCPGYFIIVDETSDISRTEQVSMCLRFVIDGEIRESFIGFHDTPSTEGAVLCDLVKKVLGNLCLDLDGIVGLCFDGAANMSGIHRGLAIRMKESSPLAIYVHRYDHVLNLAIQSTMTDIEPLRNALGVIQSLYNFIEASPKRHAQFDKIAGGGENVTKTLKSQSVTRWSCRYEAVKAVVDQLTLIVKALLELSNDTNPKTYTDSKALLNAICSFDFIIGLVVLKIVLSNTISLSKYLQGKSIDVCTARKTTEATQKTLQSCRDDDSFDLVWKSVEVLSDAVKDTIQGTFVSFRDSKTPRKKKVSRRLQALVGETSSGAANEPESAKEIHKVSTYFTTLDKVISEMSSRFGGNNQNVLCALGEATLCKDATDGTYDIISSHYDIDIDIFKSEKKIYETFASESDAKRETVTSPTATDVVACLCSNDLRDVLPLFNKMVNIFAAIPATSCSAERSFSCLRRLETYLRNTMGQTRLSSLALLNIERKYVNLCTKNVDKLIDTFANRKGRKQYCISSSFSSLM